MAQDGNTILKQILGVVTQIRDQDSRKKPETFSAGTKPLSGLFGKSLNK